MDSPKLPAPAGAPRNPYDTTLEISAHFEQLRKMLVAREELLYAKAQRRYAGYKERVELAVGQAKLTFEDVTNVIGENLQMKIDANAADFSLSVKARTDDAELPDEVDFSPERLALAYFIEKLRQTGFHVDVASDTGAVSDAPFNAVVTWPRGVPAAGVTTIAKSE